VSEKDTKEKENHMSGVELVEKLASRNLAVGTWRNQKGDFHVSLTRMGRYDKHIAIPVDALPDVIEALLAEAEKEN
jgi:hypothetical protein